MNWLSAKLAAVGAIAAQQWHSWLDVRRRASPTLHLGKQSAHHANIIAME